MQVLLKVLMLMTQKPLRQRGFTIVELLAVIAVIAILAAVTIVSFNASQRRAGTIAYTSAVDALEKQIKVAATFGALPTDAERADDGDEGDGGIVIIDPNDELAGGITYAMTLLILGMSYTLTGGAAVPTGNCIGTMSDYPATDEFAAGECYKILMAGGEQSIVSVDEAYSAELTAAKVVLPKNLPVVKTSTRSLINGSAIQAVSRGIYAVPLFRYGLMLVWSPPDTSSCGRGMNVGEMMSAAAKQQAEEAGGYEAMIAEQIAQIKSDPDQLAEVIAMYGESWEAQIDAAFGDLYNDESPEGQCILLVEYK